MFDDRTNRRSPKAEVLKVWPHASCHREQASRFVIQSNEPNQQKVLGTGLSAWDAWMQAELAKRERYDLDNVGLDTLIECGISLLTPPAGGNLWCAQVWMFECNFIVEHVDPKIAILTCVEELKSHDLLPAEQR